MITLLLISCSAFSQISHSNLENKSLSLTMTSSKTWRWVSIRTERPIKINQIPQKFGMWFTPDSDFSLKPHVVFQDAYGETFRFLFQMSFQNVPESGGYLEVKLSKPEGIEKKNIREGNHKLDVPIEFVGFDIPNRYPVYQKTVIIDNLTIDGKLIENFEKGHRWYVADKGGADKVMVKIVPSPSTIQFVQPDRFQWKIPGNLIYNSNFELDRDNDGLPDGWYAVTRDNFLKALEKNSSFQKDNISGIHRWETEGLSSKHSMSFEVPEKKWYVWRTTVEKIKPKTTYSIVLWYKQPRPSSIKIFAFGKIYDLKYMFTEQAEHWVRMSMLVDSNTYSGQSDVAIICQGPGKFWIDQVELYEGTSGIGYEQARMELYYYYDVEISPDMISPVSFGYEHLFNPQTAPEYLEFVLDLPIQVEGISYWTAIPWNDCTDKTKLITKEIKRNGVSYQRYIVRMPFSARGGYKPFTFPVGYRVGGLIRDRWSYSGSVGIYSGLTSLRWFLRTKENNGDFLAYYFVRWPSNGKRPAGRQQEKELRMKVVKVPEVLRPKRFTISLDVSKQEFKFRPDWIKDFKHIGVTRFGGHVPNNVIFTKKISEEAEREGFDGLWPWTWLTMDYNKDSNSHGTGLNGEKLNSYSLTYRGTGFKAFIERCKRYVDSGVYQVTLNDEASWECFSSSCREYFKKVFKKIYPNEPYIDPVKFEKHPEIYPKHHAVWKDFFGGMYAQAIAEVKKEVEEYMHSKGINQKFRFSASSTGLFMPKIKYPKAIEPAQNVIEEVLIQPYIYHYAISYKGNPKRVGDAISASVKASKDIGIKNIPLLSPGLGYTNPSCQLDPRSQMKYQILEGALAGMDGYQVYASNDIDLGDLRYMALANRLIVKYEDIILNGHVRNDVKFVDLPPQLKMLRSLRAKKLGGLTLIWVADYSTYKPVPTLMKIRIPVEEPMNVIDAENDLEIAKLTPENNIINIKIKEERGRLLLIQPTI